MKFIFGDRIQGGQQRGAEGMACWATSRTPRALEITVTKSVWKLGEAQRGSGAEETVQEQREWAACLPACSWAQPCLLGLRPTSANKNLRD